eukprot:TRINITY_DN6516_c2_g1_i1.p1 TRINITY_DN6516_c2_g1~~TRINITY_DN6516_c2_g1_i1.p1  ORF type:complete len:340 (-),score=68.44 TRINITY_DN6516_c2_g1_i1:184-1203(-)
MFVFLALCISVGSSVPTEKEVWDRAVAHAEETGKPESLREIAGMYYDGSDFQGATIPKDRKKSRQLYERGAAMNDPSSQLMLGNFYYNGDGGLKVNKQKAFKFWIAAADAGNVEAQVSLGSMLTQGDGVPKDWSRGIKYWEQAADGGDLKTQEHLASLYGVGELVPKDDAKAFKYLTKASKKSVDSRFRVAQMLYHGVGTTVNKNKSATMFRKLSEDGHLNATYYLGLQYANGEGVKQDGKKAMSLFDKAASKGIVNAFTQMGSLMFEGTAGVKQEKDMGLSAWRLAESKGDAEAKHILEKPEFRKEVLQIASAKLYGEGTDPLKAMMKMQGKVGSADL